VALRALERDVYATQMPRWVATREVVRYLVRGSWPVTREEALADYDTKVGSKSDIELGVHAGPEGSLVGVAGLHMVNNVARSCEFRVLLGDPSVWRQGLGTETCQLLSSYAFELLNMNRVWLGVSASNAGAHRSYEKSGFVTEGVLREEVYRNGRYHDVIRMGLLRREYEALRPTWAILPWIERQFPK
jgi:RimJ/RimL family protein N-acetyltransferase